MYKVAVMYRCDHEIYIRVYIANTNNVISATLLLITIADFPIKNVIRSEPCPFFLEKIDMPPISAAWTEFPLEPHQREVLAKQLEWILRKHREDIIHFHQQNNVEAALQYARGMYHELKAIRQLRTYEEVK